MEVLLCSTEFDQVCKCWICKDQVPREVLIRTESQVSSLGFEYDLQNEQGHIGLMGLIPDVHLSLNCDAFPF